VLHSDQQASRSAPWYGDREPPTGNAELWAAQKPRSHHARVSAYGSRWPAQLGEDRLALAEASVTSQNGEDGVIAEIMAIVGATSRTFVEFGAQNGREGNCFALADIRGWSGWFLEGDPDSFLHLAGKYAYNARVATEQAMVTAETVNTMFREMGMPSSVDVMSIDIDGADYLVWHALEAVRPRLVVIEYNSALPPDEAWVPIDPFASWDETQNFGSSLGTMLAVADVKGYDLVHCETTGVNAFFVDRSAGWTGPVNDLVPRRTPNFFTSGTQHPGFDPTLAPFTRWVP
jgi:hypothetical protein